MDGQKKRAQRPEFYSRLKKQRKNPEDPAKDDADDCDIQPLQEEESEEDLVEESAPEGWEPQSGKLLAGLIAKFGARKNIREGAVHFFLDNFNT